ncbi:TRAP transporter small permease [Acuticoccus sp. M5D2P5]|uniref:TRAP transporter small permease n=1 Tax=Acuticoccus kalidii TaxID=2910977 RepID=UPI001F280BBA|nr:TRAP transporter small permease [Acuticoccus kalidii]MCF3933268.1 TRAP transporter small permease [Acuticoccus kalidii]
MTELSRRTDALIAAILRYGIEPFLKIAGIALCLVILLQIGGREILDAPYRWTDEVSRMIFVWFSFIGAVYALAKGQHLGMTLILDNAPRPLARVLTILIGVSTILFGIVVCYGSSTVMEAAGRQVSTVLRLPMWYIYIVFPIMGVGFALCGLSQIFAALSDRFVHVTAHGVEELKESAA